MIYEVRMTIDDAEYRNIRVQEWEVDEGVIVEQGDDLLHLEADDESILTIKSPVSGVIKQIFIEEGQIVQPGDLLSIIEEMEVY